MLSGSSPLPPRPQSQRPWVTSNWMGQGYWAGVGMRKKTVRGLRLWFAENLLGGEGGGLGRRGGEEGCRM